MTIRRQLLNFGARSTDLRIGRGALDEVSTLLAGVVSKPVRACLVHGADEPPELVEGVRRALTDAGFDLSCAELQGGNGASLDAAERLFAHMATHGLTREDLLVGLGDASVCSVATFCSASWLASTPVALIPTTLDAMVCSATEMRPLTVADGCAAVEVTPQVSMIVCDLDLILGAGLDRNGMGYVKMIGAYLAESRKAWERLTESAPAVAGGGEQSLLDALHTTQSSRLNSVKSVSPSARQALRFGETTCEALRRAGVDLPDYLLLAEGMRFEARLAVDACSFSVDSVFEIEDRFEDFGIEEPVFSLSVSDFEDALRAVCHARSNRFMLPLPKYPGTIRLSHVDDDVLRRHASAYLASRADGA